MKKFIIGTWKAEEIDPDDPEWDAWEVWSETGDLVVSITMGSENAHLVAAAPDMYNALKAIVECGGGSCNNIFHETNIMVAKKALAKAINGKE